MSEPTKHPLPDLDLPGNDLDPNVPTAQEQRKLPLIVKVYGLLCTLSGLITVGLTALLITLIALAIASGSSEVSVGSRDITLAVITMVLSGVVAVVNGACLVFFGISLMSSNVLIAGDWFGNIGADWGYTAIEDQQLGGGIAWGIGEFPTLFVAIMVAVQWAKSSDREAKRIDRRENRTDDAELRAYNEMLASMAERDSKLDHRRR